MEKDDLIKDDFLRDLIQQMPLDSPSDDFVERVMAGVQTLPQTVPVQKTFFWYLKAVFPYAVMLFILSVIFLTSDLPFLNWLPGKNYYMHNLVPYFGTLFAIVKNALTSKYVSFGLLIIGSSVFLFVVDQLFSRRSTV